MPGITRSLLVSMQSGVLDQTECSVSAHSQKSFSEENSKLKVRNRDMGEVPNESGENNDSLQNFFKKWSLDHNITHSALKELLGEVPPFLVAIYCGDSKPKSVTEYLDSFMQDINNLLSRGISLRNIDYSVLVKGFICDAPARAYIKCIKLHTDNGPVIPKGLLPDNLCEHFLLFHCGMRILLSNSITPEKINLARSLLSEFVKRSQIYTMAVYRKIAEMVPAKCMEEFQALEETINASEQAFSLLVNILYLVEGNSYKEAIYNSTKKLLKPEVALL
ncbi:hypothetical protein ILUMI_10582 [Ignelater luminosus]|uniref:Uncharacterized protein n=1 Tax=Ignelater luminosus TaxID=2038154 RepID=A0A8K0D310_IGNLU|nr:hypothetical protein ILUMI_10582 [Ignelater luminosus]